MIQVGIVGGSGYTGVELLRLLAQHEQAEVALITSRSEAGVRVVDKFPNLRGHYDRLAFTAPDSRQLATCDVVFFATPHGVAQELAPPLLDAGCTLIDLSADFRLQDAAEWSRWYGKVHAAPALLQQAVYGLVEVNRAAIRSARLIAVPGCYPTAVQLGFWPLLDSGIADASRLIADCKSGVSGAGRTAKIGSLLCEASENLNAYALDGHRHLPEIRQGLRQAAGCETGLTFVPHLAPMIRGIHATLYAGVADRSVDLQALYEAHYARSPFVDVLPRGSHPSTRSVRGSNMCRMAVHRPRDGDCVVVLVVIDNLLKGASGQAVQCMNVRFGVQETLGLAHIAALP